jgi:hypothetical protein
MLGRLRLLIVPFGVAALFSVAGLPAQAAGQQVDRDDVALTLNQDGSLHAKETITYEFAGNKSIQRVFVTKIPDTDIRDRAFKISGVTASSSDGGPAAVSVAAGDDRTTVHVSAGQPLTGRHTVSLEYDVQGAILGMGAIEELRWTAIGGWQVPVQQAHVTVSAQSASIRSLNCFAGVLQSSTGCTQFFTNHTQTTAEFGQQNMLSGEYLTVVVGYPATAAKAAPLYAERRTLATAFSVNSFTGSALLALLVLLLGGFALVYQLRGRDARTVGLKAAEGDQAPLSDGSTFAPPGGVRPGQVGTLIDEQADVIDVTATIVDLAVQGYLLIEEESRAETGRLDWRLVKLGRSPDDLLRYERMLYDALFDRRDSIGLSELGGTFGRDLAKVRNAMYDDVVSQGWFARRPDAVRTTWTTAGYIITGIGVIGTILLAVFTNLALTGLAIIIAGSALAMGGRYMPAKTVRGSTVLAHTIGFRAHLMRGAPASGIPDAQRLSIFSRYLPYAVVFDCIGPWAKTIEDAGVKAEGADNLYWYEGPAEWDLSNFAESMRAFILAVSGSISQSRQFRGL